MTATGKKAEPRGQTPSMTVGPFFHYELSGAEYGRAPVAGTVLFPEAGGRIRVVGKVLDARGAPVDDALVEIWQADAAGKFADKKQPPFAGFGRCISGADGEFAFNTVKPGVAWRGSAPHISATLFARGLTCHLFTRVYFPDEAAANAADPVLRGVPAARRKTLIAKRRESPDGAAEYLFNIRLRGKDETVFLDF